MFSTNLAFYENANNEIIKNQNVTIKPHDGTLDIIADQDYGTPGVILSQYLLLVRDKLYNISVDASSHCTLILWLGNSLNEMLDIKYLDSGHNVHQIRVLSDTTVKIGIFFVNPDRGATFTLNKITVDHVQSKPSQDELSRRLSKSSVAKSYDYHCPPSPKSRIRVDHYVSDQEISDQLERLKCPPRAVV